MRSDRGLVVCMMVCFCIGLMWQNNRIRELESRMSVYEQMPKVLHITNSTPVLKLTAKYQGLPGMKLEEEK